MNLVVCNYYYYWSETDSQFAASDYKRAQVPMIIKLKPTFSLFDALMLKSRLLPHHCPFIRTTRSQPGNKILRSTDCVWLTIFSSETFTWSTPGLNISTQTSLCVGLSASNSCSNISHKRRNGWAPESPLPSNSPLFIFSSSDGAVPQWSGRWHWADPHVSHL